MREEHSAWRQFGHGAAAVSPICVAAIPIGLVWGALAAERGLSVFEIGLMSATVFAGASQFVAIGLWADPLPALAIVFAALMVNLRHMMMSASLGRRMAHFSTAQRYISFYGMTDEVWALAEARALRVPLTPSYYAGLAVPLFLCWLLGTLGGGLFGQLVGDTSAYGLDFALAAMFIGLVVGFRRLPAWLPVVVTSAAVSVASYQILPSPWFVIAGSIAAMAVAAMLAPQRQSEVLEA